MAENITLLQRTESDEQYMKRTEPCTEHYTESAAQYTEKTQRYIDDEDQYTLGPEEYEELFPQNRMYDAELNEEYQEAILTADDRNEPPLTHPFPIVKVKKRKRKFENKDNTVTKIAKVDSQNGNTEATVAVPKTKTAEDRKMMAQKMREKRRLESLAKKKETENEKARLAAAIANRKKQVTSTSR
ncbi:uncharacterized protein LOC144440265 [Glandiceps talaboti]